jgi:hypothetical protein
MATTSESPGDTSSNLSTGAKVGIGVGVVLGFVVVAGVLVLCYRQGRKKERKAGNGGLDVTKSEGKPELEGTEGRGRFTMEGMPEMDATSAIPDSYHSQPLNELESLQRPELDASTYQARPGERGTLGKDEVVM